MGKEGLRLVLRFFNEEGVPKKDAREAADHCLTNYRFVYKNPDDDTVCSDVLGLGSGPQAHQAQPKKSPARPGPVVGPMRAQGWA